MARHAVSDALAPHLEDLFAVELSVTEAVTNAVVHAYPDDAPGEVEVKADLDGKTLAIEVSDRGGGVKPASLKAHSHGLGLRLIVHFAKELCIRSQNGTTLVMVFSMP